jgi:class 3 adenylate cyclase/tetratricopeptide (TPR) repeat protein
VKCGHCLQENKPRVQFCEHCGALLNRACTACGTQISPSTRFCPECGHPNVVPPTSFRGNRFRSPDSYTPRHLAERIFISRSALEGERKQVTVLFADLKSSLELLANPDPEEARRILDPVLELMMEAVHHYEGTVNQVMGDGIMALFGAPLAYEDHAIRGCFAALRMRDRFLRHADAIRQSRGIPIQMRMGLNSGEVVVRSVGNDLRTDYTAVGQTTHLAARMEQMAEPGSILITADTLRLVEGYVQATSLGQLPVRGLDTPVDVYAITGPGTVRSPLAASAVRGLTSFVGRESELTQLEHAKQAVMEGHGRVVGLVGDPGIGKSRLLYEFTLPERMSGWLILKAGAVSYSKATAYGPLIDVIHAYFMLDDRADREDLRERITTRILALDPDLAELVPPLLALLNLPVEDPQWSSLAPSQRRQQTMDAVKRLLLNESQVRPLCLVFEDLHWIDSETEAFLYTLAESLEATRTLLLVNYRPEYRHRWAGKAYHTELRISPLSPPNANELLQVLVGDHDSLGPVTRLLIERTEGNPFFLEESVRMLLESNVLVGERGSLQLAKPIDTIRVPPTVQAVLAARIDRLAPDDKRLLQCAAVIGESFPVGLLQSVADVAEGEVQEALARLVDSEFIHDISLLTEPHYFFRHGLTCRVAYDSLVRDRRHALHARIVDWIEHLYPERLVEHVERLAHHALNGRLWDRAAHYLRQAGTKAFAKSANREAVMWFEQALHVLERLPEGSGRQSEAVELHLGLRNALTLLGEHHRTLGHLHQAQALAEQLGDRARLGRALSFEVNCLMLLGQHDSAVECARRARAVAEELNNAALKIVTDMYAARAHLNLGEYARAIELFGGIVTTLTGPLAYEHLGLPTLPSVFARSHLAECLAAVGRFDDSARYIDEAIAIARTRNHPDTTLWAYYAAGIHHRARGNVPAATEALERAYSVCQIHDMLTYRPRISSELALAWALGGREKDAVPIVRQAAEQAAARRQTWSYSEVLRLQAEVYLLANQLADAKGAASQALDFFKRQRERGHEAYTLCLLGDIAARDAAATPAEAHARYDESSRLAEALGMRPLQARCLLGRGHLLLRIGQAADARQAFQSAAAVFRDLKMDAALARAEAGLAAVS